MGSHDRSTTALPPALPPAGSGARKAEIAQTLDRGLQILELLSVEGSGMTVADIARALDMSRTIVHRLLATLMARHFVHQGADGRFRLGSTTLQLAHGILADLQRSARPELKQLADELGATAHITFAEDDDAIALIAIEPQNTVMHVAYRVGSRHPLHLGAAGMAILSLRPPDPNERPEVTTARARGYAVSRGDLNPGAVGVSAPLRFPRQFTEASVGIITFGDVDEDRVARRVIEAATTIVRGVPASV